jgi:hypothetical protein
VRAGPGHRWWHPAGADGWGGRHVLVGGSDRERRPQGSGASVDSQAPRAAGRNWDRWQSSGPATAGRTAIPRAPAEKLERAFAPGGEGMELAKAGSVRRHLCSLTLPRRIARLPWGRCLWRADGTTRRVPCVPDGCFKFANGQWPTDSIAAGLLDGRPDSGGPFGRGTDNPRIPRSYPGDARRNRAPRPGMV